MRATLAYITLSFLHATLVKTAPATPDAGTDSGTTLIQANNLTPSSPSTESRLSSSFCSKTKSTNQLTDGDIQIHRFAVPDTTTVLNVFYCPSAPIAPDLIRETIAAARIHMSDHVDRYGDGTLYSVDDPYNTPLVEGVNCTMEIRSQRFGRTQYIAHRMTYQVVLNALRGLFGFLYTDDHAGSAVAEVIDPGLTGSMIRVGAISVTPILGV